ncbi:MAG: Rab family GTPase [Candidatus Heimdallarchaeaceae archaeon]
MIYKILVLGDYNVGKSSFFQQFEKSIPGAEKKPSIKLDLIQFTRKIEGEPVIVNLYDIPGRELTNANRSKHYIGVHGAFVIFDVCNPNSFRHAPFWIEELINYNGFGKVPIVLIGNKTDLRATSQRTLNPIDAKEYVFRLNRTSKKDNVENHFFELSSKTGKGLTLIIDQLLESIKKHRTPK